jgi:hypothetical protein
MRSLISVRPRTLLLSAAFAVLVSAILAQQVLSVIDNLHVAFADEQIEIFEDMVQKSSVATKADEIALFRQYTQSYYPSGTKQITGSKLDFIVETARKNALARIDAYANAHANRK